MAEFAPILTKVAVELEVIDCLKDWLSTVLADVEDSEPNLAKGQIARPKTWQSDIDVRKLPENSIPALICVVGEGTPNSDGQFIHMDWPLVVGLITRGKNRQQGRDVAGYYAAAIFGTVLWKLSGRGSIFDVTPGPISFGEHEGDPGIVGADTQLQFTVKTQAALDLFGGPTVADSLPHPPAVPDWPAYPDDGTIADADYNPKVDVESVPPPDPFEE